MPHDHFKGKSAKDHLIEARLRTARATGEAHGVEAPGHILAGCDAAKETALITTLVWLVLTLFQVPQNQRMLMLLLGFIGWVIWKIGRSSLLAWSRLSKLHRVISEEKHEIETNRDQEREELTEMYAARGFSGKLLEDTIDVLMADDNRLLQVMLEEELGLSLESYVHPLKQAFGCAVGVIGSSAILWICLALFGTYGLLISGLCVVIAGSVICARIDRNPTLAEVVWNLAVYALASGSTLFLTRYFVER